MDIYDEDSRFTPLGTDATVVYGYKDLLIRNNKNEAIQFKIEVFPKQIIGTICSKQELIPIKLKFRQEEESKQKKVWIYDEHGNCLNESIYLKN